MKEAPALHKLEYEREWGAAVNKFTSQFIEDFCFADGKIDWNKLVSFVSGSPVKVKK